MGAMPFYKDSGFFTTYLETDSYYSKATGFGDEKIDRLLRELWSLYRFHRLPAR
jgi:hypothetical protein